MRFLLPSSGKSGDQIKAVGLADLSSPESSVAAEPQSSSVWSLAALSMFVLALQVEGKSSIILTFKQLIAEEGPWGLTKGLSARIISATPSTIVIVVGYETLKKLSLRPELVDSRHW